MGSAAVDHIEKIIVDGQVFKIHRQFDDVFRNRILEERRLFDTAVLVGFIVRIFFLRHVHEGTSCCCLFPDFRFIHDFLLSFYFSGSVHR